MTIGPTAKAMTRDVTTAPAERKVMYWKTLKMMWTSEKGGRR